MSTLEKLESIPAKMAEAVIPVIETATIEDYKHFLNAMYHYTRLSGVRLALAAEKTEDKELKTLFSELAEEERNHYTLAISDLHAFDCEVDDTPIPLVEEFHQSWMTRTNPIEWLGMVFALESIGGHLVEAALSNLSRAGISKEQASFILVHLEADEDHSERAHRMCSQHLGSKFLLESAQYAADFWVNLHKKVLAE